MSDPTPKPEDELAGTEQPFVTHLMELRDRLVRSTPTRLPMRLDRITAKGAAITAAAGAIGGFLLVLLGGWLVVGRRGRAQ